MNDNDLNNNLSDSSLGDDIDREVKEAESENDAIQKKVDHEIVDIVQDVDKKMVKLIEDTE